MARSAKAPKRLTHSRLAATVCEAILKANNDFDKMTGGSWLGEFGVEGFAVAHVSRAIKKKWKHLHIFQEVTYATIRKVQKDWKGKSARDVQLRLRPGPQPKLISGTKRVDILIAKWIETHQKYKLIAAVEIKRVHNEKFDKDIDRLVGALAHYRMLRFGVAAVFVQSKGSRSPKDARVSVNEKIERIASAIRSSAKRKRYSPGRRIEDITPAKKYLKWYCAGAIALGIKRERT